MLLIIVLLNYDTLAKLILAKLASKNKMLGFMKPALNAGNPMDQFTLGSDLHLDDPFHPFFKNQKFFIGLA
jgi:hypothetical protein